MDWKPEYTKSKSLAIRHYLLNLQEELSRADEFLSEQESKDFRGYYNSFYNKPFSNLALRRLISGYIRGDLGYILNKLVNHNSDVKPHVLDAGSGQGTQSILFSLLGCNVLGIDLRKDRHSIAIKRHKFYEKELSMKIAAKFELSSIFNIKNKNSFDMIWISNAISHIDPVDQLLNLCFDLLKPDGELIIVDLNGLNVFKQFNVLRERGLNIYKKVKDPITNQEVSYAVERILSLPSQCNLLTRSGFQISHRECFIGLHSRVPETLYKKIIKPLNSSYLFSSIFGGRYVVVGKKPSK